MRDGDPRVRMLSALRRIRYHLFIEDPTESLRERKCDCRSRQVQRCRLSHLLHVPIDDLPDRLLVRVNHADHRNIPLARLGDLHDAPLSGGQWRVEGGGGEAESINQNQKSFIELRERITHSTAATCHLLCSEASRRSRTKGPSLHDQDHCLLADCTDIRHELRALSTYSSARCLRSASHA